MVGDLRVSLFDMIVCLSRAVDLVSPELADHHLQVGFVASSLSAQMHLPANQQNDLMLAGILHDVGAMSVEERLEALAFDGDAEALSRHALQGCLILEHFAPFAAAALLIRYHHTRWDQDADLRDRGEAVPLGSHVLHLADRIAVLVCRDSGILGEVSGIRKRIDAQFGKMFCPDLADAFAALSERESFWLDLASPSMSALLDRRSMLPVLDMDIDQITDLSRLFSKIIDFRSPFTSAHSQGVAAVAEALARVFGFCDREARLMKVAGYLHDLGKLAVPSTILDKPGRLTEEERNLIRTHTFHTYRTLEPIAALRAVNQWASFHHERIDGRGYPFHLRGEELPLPARIMAVADVFTALTEDRPYRKAMAPAEVTRVLRGMVEDGGLDGQVVASLEAHYDEMDSCHSRAQLSAGWEYQEISLASGETLPITQMELVPS
jgi:HD-GYP domain-containing protein (c-di-GMP phosphodiesterase class II)